MSCTSLLSPSLRFSSLRFPSLRFPRPLSRGAPAARLRRLLLVVIAALAFTLAFSPAARAQSGLPAADERAIRAVILGQVAAFRQDDGAAAYAFAAPEIRALFPDVGQFMEMVRQRYAPIHRPRRFEVTAVAREADGVVARAFVVGPDGRVLTAVYPMSRQPDGTWLIAGCLLVPAAERSA